MGMLVEGGDVEIDGLERKVGLEGEPAVKWISSGLESSTVMTAYGPEPSLIG